MTAIRMCAIGFSALALAMASAGDASAQGGTLSGRCRDGRTWSMAVADTERMLAAINQVRSDAARPPLLRHPALDRMAQEHSVDMACNDYFAHRARTFEGLKEKLKRSAGRNAPSWDRLAEVIGTSPTAPRQVERWLGSRPHKRALLDEVHEWVGIGLVRIAEGSKYTTYWTVDLMRERGDTER